MREQRTKEKAKKRAEQANTHQEASSPEKKKASPYAAFTDPKNIIWVILSGGMAITVLISQLLQGPSSAESLTPIYSAMLWSGLFGAALARYTSKNGWFGFAIGSALGAVLSFVFSIT